MERHSRRMENWFDIVILTVKNRPRNLLLSTRKRQTNAVRSDFMDCPRCGSNRGSAVEIDDHEPPIVHFTCESCDMEWVE